MSDEGINVLEEEIVENKKKVHGLKEDIKDATGPKASKTQQSAQESKQDSTISPRKH